MEARKASFGFAAGTNRTGEPGNDSPVVLADERAVSRVADRRAKSLVGEPEEKAGADGAGEEEGKSGWADPNGFAAGREGRCTEVDLDPEKRGGEERER